MRTCDAIVSAESANQADVNSLQSAIVANGELKRDLEADDVEVSSVLAADLMPGGMLILYALA